MMQKSLLCQGKQIIILLIFLTSSALLKGQIIQPDLLKYRSQLDSAFLASKKLCEKDSTKNDPIHWIGYANALSPLMDDAELSEKYRELEFLKEISNALNHAHKLDNKKTYLKAIQNLLAINTMEISNLALLSMDEARKFKSKADAEKAVGLFAICLENFKETGEYQKNVETFWKEKSMDWKWIRFYKAVCYRMAGSVDEAEKEYQTLAKIGWSEPTLFLELADLQLKKNKTEDAIKTLVAGNGKFPMHIKLACELSKQYVQTDQVKKAQAIIKHFGNLDKNSVELTLAKAYIYEKKGDFKKADVLYKALVKSDKYEVNINYNYASYLMRKAGTADKMDAEEFAQDAYNLLASAIDLAPNREEFVTEWKNIKIKFPKVEKDASE